MTRKEIFKIVTVVCIICASLGIFYWQTTLAKAEHVANQILAQIDKDLQEPQQRQAQDAIAAQAAVRDQIAAFQSQLDSVNVSLRETEIRVPFAGIIIKNFNVKETEINSCKIGENLTLIGRDEKLKITNAARLRLSLSTPGAHQQR